MILLKKLLLVASICVLLTATTLALIHLTRFRAKVEYAVLTEAKIAYYSRGRGDPLVFIEGFGMTMQDWDPRLIRSLASRHRLIIFDYRGVGLSTGETGRLTVQKMADDTFGLLDHLKISKTSVLGWSMGSVVAQQMVLTHPERIERVILASSFTGDVNTIGAAPEVSDLVQNNLADSWDNFYVPLMFAKDINSSREKEEYLRAKNMAIQNGESPSTPTVTAQTKVRFEEALAKDSVLNRKEELGKIDRPVLIIAGSEDILVPNSNSVWIAEQIPHSLLKMTDGGHAFLFQLSTRTARIILEFLR